MQKIIESSTKFSTAVFHTRPKGSLRPKQTSCSKIITKSCWVCLLVFSLSQFPLKSSEAEEIRKEMACSDIEKSADLQGAAQGSPEADGVAKGTVRMGLVKMKSIKMLTAKAQEVMDGPDPTSKYSFAEGLRREKAEEVLWQEYCLYGHGSPLTAAMLEKLLVKRAYDQRKAAFNQNSLLNLPIGDTGKQAFDNSTRHNGQDRDFARVMVKTGEHEIPHPHQTECNRKMPEAIRHSCTSHSMMPGSRPACITCLLLPSER